MKTRQLLALAGAFLFSIAALTSCNKENTTGKDAEQVLGKYEITDASSPIQSIELTKDGEYIVTKRPARTRSGEDLDLNDVWLYGNFTFVDGTYFLQGFGKIVIDFLTGGAAEISIDTGDWDDKVHANLASTVQETEINRELCRHWVFDRSYFSLSFSDLPFLNFGFDVDGCDFTKWFQKTGDEEGEQDLDKKCKGLIFTESGTYAVLFDNGKVNVGSWAWENKEDGSLKCEWNNQYQSFFKDYRFHGSLVVDVEEGDPATCTIVRSFDTTMERYKLFRGYSSHSMTTSLTYYLKEYK
ncbi:MAG: hypothetical protein J6P62_08320 [Bacteroidales bacterium]|nr:hypothetical protein [Bacteroidales bacterium]